MKKLGLILVVLAILLTGCTETIVKVKEVEVTRVVKEVITGFTEVEVTRIVEVDAICIEETALPSPIVTSTPTLVWIYWTPTPTDTSEKKTGPIQTVTTVPEPTPASIPASPTRDPCSLNRPSRDCYCVDRPTIGGRLVWVVRCSYDPCSKSYTGQCFLYEGPTDSCDAPIQAEVLDSPWCRANK